MTNKTKGKIILGSLVAVIWVGLSLIPGLGMYYDGTIDDFWVSIFAGFGIITLLVAVCALGTGLLWLGMELLDKDG